MVDANFYFFVPKYSFFRILMSAEIEKSYPADSRSVNQCNNGAVVAYENVAAKHDKF